MNIEPFSWKCPFCGQTSTVTSINYHQQGNALFCGAKGGAEYFVTLRAIQCPNGDCHELSLGAELSTAEYSLGNHYAGETIETWQLRPRSSAKPLPSYVPEEIRNNYTEACLIQFDSPKASAAMSRRCLQGIIRDYWEIPSNKRGNLGAEISYIKEKVDPSTFDSIIAVREVGDIGAHMTKNVDTIVNVEPEEAALLIELIETLIDDWYVARHKRDERNKKLRETADDKKLKQKLSKKQLNSEELPYE